MRAVILGLWLATCCLVAQGQDAPRLESPHARLLVYRDEAGRDQPVKTLADWRRRRQQILDGMQQAMGKLPDRSSRLPLDVKLQGEPHQGDGYVRHTLTYLAEPGDRVPAYLYLPMGADDKQRLPAMLALHPTSPLGKGVVDGQGPRPNRNYGAELAQRGYVVLAPDYPSFGDYSYDFAADDYTSGSMKGIFNHLRGVDLLSERAEVDRERIGVIGHSLGGHNAMFVAAFDERLKVTVSSCGWTPFHDYYAGKIAGWTSDRYMPRLKDVYALDPSRVPFDFYEVVAALAPRAFFSNSPLRDSNFDVAGVRKAVPLAKQVYELLDAGDRLQVRYPDSDHDFVPTVRREAYEFIDRQLQHEPRRRVPAE